MSPNRLFILANIKFSLGGKEYALEGVELSLGGVYGLSIQGFDTLKHIGELVSLRADVLTPQPFDVEIMATVATVIGIDSSTVEFKFEPGQDVIRVREAIENHGYEPQKHARKYPRIPLANNLPNMPSHAIIQVGDELIVFNVANMSPQGMQFWTESPRASAIMPAAKISVQVEARGAQFNSFEFQGEVRRIEIYRRYETKNIVYAIGVQLESFLEDDDKSEFLQVLRTVVNDLANQTKPE